MDQLIKLLPSILTFIGLWYALYVFNKQQKFKRIQNLSAIWQKFFDSKELTELFMICDQIVNGDESKIETLSLYSPQEKFRYLGLIEEVTLYTETFAVDNQHVAYLFQWHFYFIFSNETTGDAFWKNIGGIEEAGKDYWSKPRIFTERHVALP